MKIQHIFLAITISLLGFTACKKFASPAKVNRVATKGEWIISRMIYNNGDSTANYANYTFKFTETGKVIVEGDTAIVGTWTANGEPDPTRFELAIKPFVPFNLLNADWSFTTCSKKKMELSLQKTSAQDILVFDKKED